MLDSIRAGFRYYLDALSITAAGEGGSEMIGGDEKWRVPCNCKFVSEYLIDDM